MNHRLESTLPNILSFCRTFELGSFTSAAKSLQVTPAAVSRSVARLETALGTTLFRRTTRDLRPTSSGRAYYEKCSKALDLLLDAERTVENDPSAPSGLVRISAPTTFGLSRLIPALSGLSIEHPNIELELEISNHNVDFVREGFDLAIRMGTIADGSLVARRLGEFSLGVFGSKSYLSTRSAPRSPADLSQHDCIAFIMPRTGRVLPWLFAGSDREFVPLSKIKCIEDPRAGIAFAVAGVGLFQTYHFMVERELARGELVEVLERHRGRSRRFSVVYRKEATQSRAVRCVVEFILKREA